MSLAKAFVSGVVVKTPEKRFTQNDMAIAGFSINIDGNPQSVVRVTAFGQLAETVAAGINVNDTVVVEGRLQVNTYKTPDGKEKRVFEISANAVEKMNSPASCNPISQNNEQNIVSFNQDPAAEDLIDEDEIPF